ncbi:hypothetical protein COL154_014018, partial [Colletotrichum chrysophilum]
ALQPTDLEVAANDFITILGPSGCGKSTLLRIVAGLDQPSTGRVLLDGRPVTRPGPDRGMVFQSYTLFPWLTVGENIAFGLKVEKVPQQEIDARLQQAANMLQITHLLDRKPKELSGGQRQRVAIGRSIVRQPRVSLFDEPLSNLDAELRVQMRAELVNLHERLQSTMVYVTHDQVEAMTMGDRIVVMSEGRIQQVGTPDELYDAPVNRFVASFIGTPAMGFLDCGVEGEGDALALVTASARIRLDPGQSRAVSGSGARRVDVGIRPERLTVGEDPKADWTVHGTVDVVEMLGSEQYVHFSVDGGSLTARVSRDHPIRVEDQVTFSGAARHLHLFDPETGRTLC